MGIRLDPQSHTWTCEAIGNIFSLSAELLHRQAEDNFNTLIHRGLLCYFSPYYNAYLNGGFLKSGQKQITFDLSKTQAKMLVTWLYSGCLPIDAGYSDLFDLYLVANVTLTLAVKRSIMSHIYHNHGVGDLEGGPELELIMKVFNVLPKSSGLIRWLADWYAHHWLETATRSTNAAKVETMRNYPNFFVEVKGARAKVYNQHCRNTGVELHGSPCCDTYFAAHYGCPRGHPATRGHACNYHEHATAEEWRILAKSTEHTSKAPLLPTLDLGTDTSTESRRTLSRSHYVILIAENRAV
ncbi:hypothetical protein E4T47_05851 [Aureobasidium subglaciale]|nr:hypothetical protein E4T47_05851 [Aureobasidium subglaciale]